MDTKWIAFASVSRLSRLLGDFYGASLEKLAPAVLRIVQEKASPELAAMDGLEFRIGQPDEGWYGVIMGSNDAQRLLECARIVRRHPMLGCLRFSQWGVTRGGSDDSITRALRLAHQANPPNDICLADVEFLQEVGMALTTEGRTYLPAPVGTGWLSLEDARPAQPLPSVAPIVSPFKGDVLPARGYAEAHGAQALASAVEAEIEEKDCFHTLFSAIFEIVSAKKEHFAGQLELAKIGPGADSYELLGESTDQLLRLVIWVQSELAAHGGAFLGWVLGVGPASYIGDQPSDSTFLKLHGLGGFAANGDVVATQEFFGRLSRPELRELGTPEVTKTGEKVFQIRWWEFPFRSISMWKERKA